MSVKVGINGFGRIGQEPLPRRVRARADIEFVAVNDITDAGTLAHLLKYDSTLGPFPGTVEAGDERSLDGKEVKVLAERDPAKLPWKDLGVEVVVESTGLFVDRENASKHLEAGADKVIISAPAKDPDVTVALGVNFDEAYDPEAHRIISNASCTTNCLAPVAKILNDGDRDQARPDDDDPRLHRRPAPPGHAAQGPAPRPRGRDQPDPDVDRGRQGARARGARAGRQAERHLGARAGPHRSVVDLVCEMSRETSIDEINELFAGQCDKGRYEGIIQYTSDPIVSTDINKSPYSAVFDSQLTMVTDGTLAKVVAWYDNEWGYSCRLVELAEKVRASQPAL